MNPEKMLPSSEALMAEVEQEHWVYLDLQVRSESIHAAKLSWASGWFSWCSWAVELSGTSPGPCVSPQLTGAVPDLGHSSAASGECLQAVCSFRTWSGSCWAECLQGEIPINRVQALITSLTKMH